MTPLSEAIVLAGGLGTRLRSVVPDLPKPMAPVGGRPFLEYLLERLATQGVSRVVLAVGYMGEVIQSHFGVRWQGLDIAYSVERELLGTGGGIRQAMSLCAAPQVLVLNGDTMLTIHYNDLAAALAAAPDARMALALRRVEDVSRFGAATAVAGRLVRFSDKTASGPGLINAGVYLLKAGLFDEFDLPPAFSFENDFLAPFSNRLQPAALECDTYFIDMGIPETYGLIRAGLTEDT